MNGGSGPVTLRDGDWVDAFERLDDRGGGIIRVPAGIHDCDPVSIDLADYGALHNNVSIRGAGIGSSILHFGEGGGDGFALVDSEGSDVFYTELLSVGFRGERDGVLFRLGRDDFADAYNSCQLRLATHNGSPDATAACRLNHVLNTAHFGVHNTLAGTALELRQVQFGGLTGSASSRRGRSLLLEGYTMANVVEWLNVEACEDGVRITGPDAKINRFGMLYGANVHGTLWHHDAPVETGIDAAFVGDNVETIAETTAGDVSVGLSNVPAAAFQRG
jgi:hypothetical protein